MPQPPHQPLHTGEIRLTGAPGSTPHGMQPSKAPAPASSGIQPAPAAPTTGNGSAHAPAAPTADAVLDAIGQRVAEQLARQVPGLAAPPRPIDWLGYLAGVGAISTAAPRGDWGSVAVAIEQLVIATGAQLDGAAQSELVSALAARFETRPLAEPVQPAGGPTPAPKK
jgi:hypothetical protein